MAADQISRCRPTHDANVLNLFYEEPESDRWLPLDRYPRRVVRRLWRGDPQPGGHRRIFLNLCAGLDRIGVRYRINDYRWAKEHSAEPVCIVGKPHVLDKTDWANPILFGAAVFSHPLDDPDLFERRPVRKVLLPGAWMKEMWKPYWDDRVAVWPVGIDTERWRPARSASKPVDVLLYDKVRWDHGHYEKGLIAPIRRTLATGGRSFWEIRYGSYREEEFHRALAACRTMIFLCEHETQGIAYQQALSCDVPVLAWDRGGYWQDPAYFPDTVSFQPVTSVPYWDDRCGARFAEAEQFDEVWHEFWKKAQGLQYQPRAYIVENLTLEKSAAQYLSYLSLMSDF